MIKIFNRKSKKEKRVLLRNNMPPAEWILWKRINNKQLNGYKFRRQYGIGRYIVDFYCSKLKLVIELDGDSHIDNLKNDQKRQEYIESFSIRFLRFNNLDIYEDLEVVIKNIKDNLK